MMRMKLFYKEKLFFELIFIYSCNHVRLDGTMERPEEMLCQAPGAGVLFAVPFDPFVQTVD